MAHYEVIVGNIGTVHRGSSKAEALKQYKANVRDSEAGTGRGAHEGVTQAAYEECKRLGMGPEHGL